MSAKSSGGRLTPAGSANTPSTRSWALVATVGEDSTRLEWVDPETLATGESTLDPTGVASGVVSEGWFWWSEADSWEDRISGVDLDSGEEASIYLPELEWPSGVEPLAFGAAQGGFVLSTREVLFKFGPNGEVVAFHSGNDTNGLYLYNRDSGGFSILAEGVSIGLVGTSSSGELVTLPMTWAGSLVATVDPGSRRTLVSADLCLQEEGRPTLVVGDRAWTVRAEGQTLRLRPIELGEPER